MPGHRLHLPISSQVFTFRTEGDRVLIEEVYSISVGAAPVVLEYGSWKAGVGLSHSHVPLLERRWDLRGHVLRGQTLPGPPSVQVDLPTLEQGVQGGLGVGGIVGEIWHQLERSLNFTTLTLPPKDRQWGGLKEDGRWAHGSLRLYMEHFTQGDIAQYSALGHFENGGIVWQLFFVKTVTEHNFPFILHCTVQYSAFLYRNISCIGQYL
jgi:hypothetical protein